MSRDHSAQSSATIRKWEKYRRNDEESYERARKSIQAFFKEALSQDAVRMRIKQDLDERGKETSRFRGDESGYNLVRDDYDPLVDGERY